MVKDVQINTEYIKNLVKDLTDNLVPLGNKISLTWKYKISIEYFCSINYRNGDEILDALLRLNFYKRIESSWKKLVSGTAFCFE